MKNVLKLGLVAFAVAQCAWALPLDITIQDPFIGVSWGGGVTVEDNETEPNTQQGQRWDLEAFIRSGGKLGIISGFDMKSGGVADGLANYPMGDIWVNLGSKVGSGPNPPNLLDWDYVIHFTSWGAGVGAVNYRVYSLAQVAAIALTGGASAAHPNFLWQATAFSAGPIAAGAADYVDNVNNAATVTTAAPLGYAGGTHDILSGIDLAWLPVNRDAYFYTTMQCGNDMLEGHVGIPDGGLTLVLLGLGLVGVALAGRRCRR